MPSTYSKIILLILILTLIVSSLTLTCSADVAFSKNNSGDENSRVTPTCTPSSTTTA